MTTFQTNCADCVDLLCCQVERVRDESMFRVLGFEALMKSFAVSYDLLQAAGTPWNSSNDRTWISLNNIWHFQQMSQSQWENL